MGVRRISVGPTPKDYSHAIVAGDLVFTSGLTPHDEQDVHVLGATIEEQTGIVLDKLEAVLAAAGSDLAHLVQVTVSLTDIDSDYPGFDATYRARVPRPMPPRLAVGARLFGYRVEMMAVAALVHERGTTRRTTPPGHDRGPAATAPGGA